MGFYKCRFSFFSLSDHTTWPLFSPIYMPQPALQPTGESIKTVHQYCRQRPASQQGLTVIITKYTAVSATENHASVPAEPRWENVRIQPTYKNAARSAPSRQSGVRSPISQSQKGCTILLFKWGTCSSPCCSSPCPLAPTARTRPAGHTASPAGPCEGWGPDRGSAWPHGELPGH